LAGLDPQSGWNRIRTPGPGPSSWGAVEAGDGKTGCCSGPGLALAGSNRWRASNWFGTGPIRGRRDDEKFAKGRNGCPCSFQPGVEGSWRAGRRAGRQSEWLAFLNVHDLHPLRPGRKGGQTRAVEYTLWRVGMSSGSPRLSLHHDRGVSLWENEIPSRRSVPGSSLPRWPTRPEPRTRSERDVRSPPAGWLSCSVSSSNLSPVATASEGRRKHDGGPGRVVVALAAGLRRERARRPRPSPLIRRRAGFAERSSFLGPRPSRFSRVRGSARSAAAIVRVWPSRGP